MNRSMKKRRVAFLALIAVLSVSTAVLAEDPVTVEPEVTVVVTASRILQDILDAPVSVSVITRQEIQSSGALNVADTLRSVPGVIVPAKGSLGSEGSVQLRGSSSSHVLVLLDGRRINSPQFGGVDLSRISTDMVERIEIIKGPASSLYGSDSLAGVINIITASGLQNSHTVLETKTGSYDTQTMTFSGMGQVGEVGYGLMAESVKSAGYRPNSDYDGASFWGRLDVPLTERDTLQFGVNYHQGELGAPGPVGMPMYQGRQEDRIVRTDLLYERILGTDAVLNVRGFKDATHQVYSSGATSTHDVGTTGLEFQVDQQLLDGRHRVTYGGTVGEDQVESTDLVGKKRERASWALFAQDVVAVTPRLDVTLSNRYDDYSTHGGNFSYRVGMSYDVTVNTSAYASYGTAFRAPTINDMYSVGGGNPNLRPETSKAYEVGIERYIRGGRVSAAYFNRVVDDLIAWLRADTDDPESGYAYEPRNVNKATFRGVDFEVEAELLPGLTGRAGYMFLLAEDANTGQTLEGKTKHQGSLGLTYSHFGGLWTGLKISAFGERFYQSRVLPGYAVVDLSVGQAFDCGASVKLEVSNLLNRAYEDMPDYPAPPRIVTFGISYSF